MAHEAAHTNTKITPESVSCLFKWSHSSWVVQWDPAQGGFGAKGHCRRRCWEACDTIWEWGDFQGLQLDSELQTPSQDYNWALTSVALRLSGWQSDIHGESDNRSNHIEEQKATIGATWPSITPQQGHRLSMLLFFTNNTQTTPVRLLGRPPTVSTLFR